MNTQQAVAAFEEFTGPKLTRTLAVAEAELRGANSESLPDVINRLRASASALSGARELKRIAAQIHVVIHALGIVRCLPHLLEPGETVEYVSLGAGNTGRRFDLETDRRAAEFKFIRWQGGSETIRQNSIFKDLFLLAEDGTPKRKYLYVLGTHYPLKFLRGRRALRSVLKDAGLAAAFQAKHGDRYDRVKDYYEPRQHLVTIQDISGWLPELSGGISVDALSDLTNEDIA